MKKILIAIPTMSTVPTEFMASMLGLQTVEQTKISIAANSLVYMARNQLAMQAIDNGFDYIFWLDSDMTFPRDALKRLYQTAVSADFDLVSGIYFTKSIPPKPVVYKEVKWDADEDGTINHEAEPWYDYPKDEVFGIGGTGFGGVLVKTQAILDVAEKFRCSPFEPLPMLGEDLSFCWRMSQLGKHMVCDSRVKFGHVGSYVFDENVYAETRKPV